MNRRYKIICCAVHDYENDYDVMLVVVVVLVVILKFLGKDWRKPQEILERLGALLAGIQTWIFPAMTETC